MSSHDLEFKNIVVLITGAASGLGAALAEVLGNLGAKLVLGDLNASALGHFVSHLQQQNIAVVSLAGDVCDEAYHHQLVDLAISNWEKLDIAVNNADIATGMKAFTEITLEEFDHTLNVNSKGVFLGMKAQISTMLKQQSGNILNVSSVAGLNAAPKLAAYSASKHAVIGLTKTAAIEYAKKNIRVNAICPFYTATPLVTQSELSDKIDFLNIASPMKRIAETKEIISVMMMLCSPQHTYLTGQAIAVDGGVTAL